MHEAFQWLMYNQGSIAQRNYPYTGVVRNCRHNEFPKVASVSGYSLINGEMDLLNAVETTGTVRF